MATIAWELCRRSEAYAADCASLTDSTKPTAAHLAARWGMQQLVPPARAEPPCWQRAAVPLPAPPIVTFEINLAQPLTGQFNDARIAASQLARDWRKAHRQVRARRLNKAGENRGFYIDLLRVIDAANAGAEPSEIKEQLWPHLEGQCGRDKLRYMLKRAEDLLEGDFAEAATCDATPSKETDLKICFPRLPHLRPVLSVR